MTNLMIGVLSAVMTTNPPAVGANAPLKTPPDSLAASTNAAVEQEFQRMMAEDDAAQAEVDKWIRDNNEFTALGAGLPKSELNQRILLRFGTVRQSYEDFIQRHPDHVRARLAYASFLGDIQEEDAAAAQIQKALDLDPKNAAAWNNLGNHYGSQGLAAKAFDCFAKAIEIEPRIALYHYNYGKVIYLFPKEAAEHFQITEGQVFEKVLALYGAAMKLAPDDFPLASDLAQAYYGIRPLRVNEALQAWTNALGLAHDEIEREGVQLHLARVKLAADRLDETRSHLDSVTNAMYAGLKQDLAKLLSEKQSGGVQSNAPPPAPITR